MNSGELCPGTFEHAIFEKLRRCGASRADGQRIEHDGREYDLTVNTISRIETVHVVAQDVTLPETGIQRAMAVVSVYNNGYRGGHTGCAYVLEALIRGLRVPDFIRTRSHFVLPVLEVPGIFASPQDEGAGEVGPIEAEGRGPDSVPDCTERLASAIELHSDETSNELSRAADAMERIADSVEGVAALFAQVAKDESASLKATRETTIEAANAFMAAITQSDAAP